MLEARATLASCTNSLPVPPAPALVLGFDFGTRRIGVALADTLVKNARPLVTIDAEANAARFAAIEKLIHEWQPARLIVGLPLTLEGAEHDMTRRCRRFAQQLHGRFGLPVEFADERLSSVAAESQLGGPGATRRDKASIDAAAAAIILQAWLDDPRRESRHEPALSS